MATTEAPVNGNYAPHQGYGALEHQSGNYPYSASSSTPSQSTVTQTTAVATPSTPAQAEVPKDEVGWYFVEQYYTTLSRAPEKLYLFYQKRSQFVSGQETDKVAVCVGQRAINERIKELDYQDCKVRVTNVDSQASDSHIVIQVIGEISNKSQPHKKFTQTFVLATQTNGYFVLNDIFRYLMDEEDEVEQTPEAAAEEVQQVPAAEGGLKAPPPTAAEVEPKGLTTAANPAESEDSAQQVDREIQNKIPAEQHVESAAPKTNGVAAAAEEEDKQEDDVVPSPAVEEAVAEEEPAAAPVQEEKPQPEKPAEPAPTSSPPKQATPQPAPAPKPAAPKTWASLAASANRVATPSAPSPASSSTSQTKPAPRPAAAAPAVQAQSSAPAPSATPTAQRDASPAADSQGDEWTAVGGSHNRNQSRQAASLQQDQPRAYIAKVFEHIDPDELKAHLQTFGEVTYFDIARQKNCAFVDFKTFDGYNAAINANPHTINGEDLFVEKRKFHPGATPYVPRGQYQGRGRGGPIQGAPRGGFQGRGNYQPRGRGGNGAGTSGAPRGRGGSSIAT